MGWDIPPWDGISPPYRSQHAATQDATAHPTHPTTPQEGAFWTLAMVLGEPKYMKGYYQADMVECQASLRASSLSDERWSNWSASINPLLSLVCSHPPRFRWISYCWRTCCRPPQHHSSWTPKSLISPKHHPSSCMPHCACHI